MTGKDLDLHAVTAGEFAGSGVAHADALVAFAEAIVGDDDGALASARAELLDETGPEALVDAAAVASNFMRMVRIADSTGISLDAPMALMSQDLRAELGIDRFGSAANTPPASPLERALGRVLPPLARAALKLYGAVSRGPGGGS
jgi:hypothetical protein